MSSTFRPVIAIVGPTASGKSDLALALALRLGAEIISCDSVQVYSGIQIATAKVPLTERMGVPHHLLDFVAPTETYSAAAWANDAARTICEIEARQQTAILAGGTGFYLRTLRQPLFPGPATDMQLRLRLQGIRERRGVAHLYSLLQRVDQPRAAQLTARDWPRIQRALEVRFQTGTTLSAQSKATPPMHEAAARLRIFALNPPRQELYERINLRTTLHFESGLVDEVRALLSAGVSGDSVALGAHGYRRVVEFLRGERTIESALAQAQADVRHYAKRQLTWFRREPDIHWIQGFGTDHGVAEQVLSMLDMSAQVAAE